MVVESAVIGLIHRGTRNIIVSHWKLAVGDLAAGSDDNCVVVFVVK